MSLMEKRKKKSGSALRHPELEMVIDGVPVLKGLKGKGPQGIFNIFTWDKGTGRKVRKKIHGTT